jgi:hypothetical protein
VTRAHYYPDVPGLGNVAVSRHAQAQLDLDKISEEVFADVLQDGRDIHEPGGITRREGKGIAIVILNRPEPFRGAMLVKTVFRVKAQATAVK